jgi:hypothetical protein
MRSPNIVNVNGIGEMSITYDPNGAIHIDRGSADLDVVNDTLATVELFRDLLLKENLDENCACEAQSSWAAGKTPPSPD